ncbi:hypothetical protein [Kitasatospora sp. NPDC001527]|uniref:hypothetical protein n=1 Tax=Kitasatospora sp. NPDC001527 TaxID=3154519 RepID=UPI00332A5F76
MLVGTDRQVWHTYRSTVNGSWSTWSVLGSASGVLDGVEGKYTNGIPSLRVIGSDYDYWCNTINGSGSWTDWFPC